MGHHFSSAHRVDLVFIFLPFLIHLHSSVFHHPMKYMHVLCFRSLSVGAVAGCGTVCLSHSFESIKEAVAVSPVLGDEQYKRMSRVTGPANNSKEFILVNGHVGH